MPTIEAQNRRGQRVSPCRAHVPVDDRALARRITVVVAVLVLLLLILAGFTLLQNRAMQRELVGLTETDVPLVRIVTTAREHYLHQHLQLDTLSRIADQTRSNNEIPRERVIASFKERGRDFKQAVADAEKLMASLSVAEDPDDPDSSRVREQLRILRESHDRFEIHARSLLDLYVQNHLVAAGDRFALVEKEATELDSCTSRTLVECETFLLATAKCVEKAAATQTHIIGMLAGLEVLVAIVMVVSLLRYTSRHIHAREITLRANEARMRAIADYTSDWESWLRPDGRVEWTNPAVEQVTSYSVAECLNMPDYPVPIVYPADRRGLVQRLEHDLATEGAVHDMRLRIVRKDGVVRQAAVSWQAIYSDDGDYLGLRTSLRDTSEHEAMEERLRQRQAELAHASRVRTLDHMATSIAHELNQPLAAAGNYAQACLERVRNSQPDVVRLGSTLQKLVGQLERAGEIIHRVRGFVSNRESTMREASINALVHNAVAFMEHDLNEQGVTLQLALDDELPPVLVDSIQIEQVLVNLLRNALDAIAACNSGDRTIRICTKRMRDTTVEISVCDSGIGLSAEAADAMFLPFATTKADGLGMGLPISQTIVEAHAGSIWTSPNSDRGITVTFMLPIERAAEGMPCRCQRAMTLSV